jgi:ABC-type nitrate/sulfonate/bicarbonate transport system substrate-binding protein
MQPQLRAHLTLPVVYRLPPPLATHPSTCAVTLLDTTPLAGPDTAVKTLIATVDALQQQQAHADAARLAAQHAAAAASADASRLQCELHAALGRLSDLDDREQAAHSALHARLLQQGQLSDQLR